jgi:hypothetical protein
MIARSRFLASVIALALLAACDRADRAADRDEIADRIEADIPADRGTAAERREAAEALADDVLSLADEAAELQPAEDARNEALERELGSPDELRAAECEQQNGNLAALRRLVDDPGRERLTPEEVAGLPDAVAAAEAERDRVCS